MSAVNKYFRDSLVGIAGKATKLVGGYGSLWLLTQILTESGYGNYVTGFAIATLVALFAQAGLRQATIQRVSELSVNEPREDVYEYAGAAIFWVSLAGILAGTVLWLSAPLLTLAFPAEELVLWAKLLAPLIPGMAVWPICTGVLRGFERITEAIVLNQILGQLVRLLGLGISLFFWPTPAGVVLALGGSFYVPILVFALYSRGGHYLNPTGLTRSHLKFSSYLLANSIASRFLKNTDVLLLSMLAGAAATGGYNVAWKIAVIVRYGDQILTNVLQPRISRFLEKGENEALMTEYNWVRDTSVAVGMPVVLIILLFGNELLGVFGSYVDYYSVLLLLALGGVINASFGTVGQLLVMGKQGRLILLNTVFSLGSNIVLNAVLIPHYGSFGAAIATVITVYFLTNLLGALEVKYFMGIDTLDGKTFVATGFVTGAVVLQLVDYSNSTLVATIAVIVASALLLYRNKNFLTAAIADRTE